MVEDEPGFGVKGIHVSRPAVHEQENDAFGFGGKVRRAGRQWVGGFRQQR